MLSAPVIAVGAGESALYSCWWDAVGALVDDNGWGVAAAFAFAVGDGVPVLAVLAGGSCAHAPQVSGGERLDRPRWERNEQVCHT